MSLRRSAVIGTTLAGIVAALCIWGIESDEDPAPVGAATTTPTSAPLAPLQADPSVLKPSQLTTWPWPNATVDKPHRGVTHYYELLKDGTTLDLLHFDFASNPNLRLELYSQDQDDKKPWDNIVRFWPLGVGPAIRHLNTIGRGPVVAAWNGPFFGYYHKPPLGDAAFHVAPVVIDGQLHHNTVNHRWTFGVKYKNGQPTFKTFHMPGRAILSSQFDFASGSLQCLIKDGKPLHLQPFPKPGQPFAPQPFPSTPNDVGHIRFFDHAKFSRASLAWSKDNKQLWMILVREPKTDNEGQSIYNLIAGVKQEGGWDVPDLQRFWISFMAHGLIYNAINSDAGDAGQLCYMLPDGNYSLIPPRNASPFERRTFNPQFAGAAQGGALMYFYVREATDSKT